MVGLATQISAASGELPCDSCQGRDRLTHSHDLPRAMSETRLAPGDGNQVRTVTRGSPHVLAVAEPLPCLRRLQGSPVAEIRIIAFVRASWEVRHTSGRDEQQPRARRRRGMLLRAPMRTRLPAHVTEFAVNHPVSVHPVQVRTEGAHGRLDGPGSFVEPPNDARRSYAGHALTRREQQAADADGC